MDATLNEPLVDTDRIATLIEQLTAKQATLPHPGDLKSDNERARHYATSRDLASTISALQNAGVLAKPMLQLAELEARREAVVAKRCELDDRLADMPEVTEIKDRF